MTFDPKKFIDREFEQELFEHLLVFKSPARVLTVQDTGGMGKSHLMGRFQYRCRTVPPRIPISLIRIEELTDHSPLFVVQTIAEQLSAFKLKFPEYYRLENARVHADFSFIRSAVYLNDANLSGTQNMRIGSTIIEKAENFSVVGGSPKPLTSDEQRVAQGLVIHSFFQDLLKTCATQPVVLIVDSYEKADEKLRRWIEEYLLENYFFNVTPADVKLAIVIAGRTVPYCLGRWSESECQAIVKSIERLRTWRKEHVEECLRVHGFKYEQADLEAFFRLIERGMPPSEVISVMETYLRR